MNDRFKFRYVYNNTIYDVFAVDFMNKTAQLVSLDRFEILFKSIDTDKLIQCTGLKDKNGTLIYEGDILKEIFESDGEFLTDITTVEYLEGAFILRYQECPNDFAYFSYLDLKDYEVIGNIYESEIPDGRSETSPDSEQMEQTGAKPRQRHSVSVEEFQDNKELLQ